MGKKSFISREIPVTGEVREVINESFTFHNKEYKATCLTVGNPHCIIFMNQVTPELAKELGPYVENAVEPLPCAYRMETKNGCHAEISGICVCL